jgi:fluoride exporter
VSFQGDDDPPHPTPDRGARPDGAPEPAPLGATRRPRLGLPPAGSVGMVGIGGAAGALARTAQSAAFPVEAGAIPWSTFAENLAGAFLLGVLLTLLVERVTAPWWVRPLLGTGLLGAYTTYATVGLELHQLVADGSAGLAVAYLWATALAGLLAGGAGIAAARLRLRSAR